METAQAHLLAERDVAASNTAAGRVQLGGSRALVRGIATLAMLLIGAAIARAGQTGAPAPGKASMAVLPFAGPPEPDGYGFGLPQGLRDGLGQGVAASVRARVVQLADPAQVVHGEAIIGPVTGYLPAPSRILGAAVEQFQMRITAREDQRVRETCWPVYRTGHPTGPSRNTRRRWNRPRIMSRRGSDSRTSGRPAAKSVGPSKGTRRRWPWGRRMPAPAADWEDLRQREGSLLRRGCRVGALEKLDVPAANLQGERYVRPASTLPTEKDWAKSAQEHPENLRRGGAQTSL